MKTFVKWLNNSNYNYVMSGDNFSTSYTIEGVQVIISNYRKGGVVQNAKGYIVFCGSVKELISTLESFIEGDFL